MNVFNTYNTDEYQISLTDNSLVSIKKAIKYPTFFNNNDIVEVTTDITTDNPVMLIRYDNGYIYAFDYYQGEELFTYGEKPEVSLFRYVFSNFKDEITLSNSSSYGESGDLKVKIENVSNQKVKDKLTVTIDNTKEPEESTDSEIIIDDEPGESKEYKKPSISKGYIQVYNYDTNTYEVYNTEDILNAKQETVISEDSKIRQDVFLYKYFYDDKLNNLLESSKIIIYIGIIVLVVFNLFLLVR
jgi:hypothetical protein